MLLTSGPGSQADSVRDVLQPRGLLFSATQSLAETDEERIGCFITEVWEQNSCRPVTSTLMCFISFSLVGKGRID